MKKNMKKLVSLLLTLVMVFAMTITVFADGTTATAKISVPSADSHTYAVYQIFTGDLSGTTLSNIKWGQNGTGTAGQYVDASVSNAIAATADKSDTEQLAVINEYVNLDSTAIGTVTKDKALENLAPGYYLIKDKDAVTGNDAATLYIVKLVGDLSISRKAEVPSVDKEILDPDATKTNEASIGNTVNYQFTGSLPSNYADYNSYYYKFTDTLSKGLTYTDGSIEVKVVNGEAAVDVTKYFYTEASTYSNETGTTIEVSIADLVALKNVDGVTVNKDTKIVVTYSATLNENAVIAGAGNPNDVDLTFSNNPNDSGDGKTDKTPNDQSTNPEQPTTDHPTGTTPKSEVKTYTTELTILKTDANNKFLPGTEFTLTGNGVDIILVTTDTFAEDTNGTYYKLKDGTYTTTEPTEESYVEKTAGDDKVVATADVKIYTKDGDNYKEVSEVAANETYYVKKPGNTDDYDSTTTKYAKTTTVTQKSNTETETNVVGVIGADGTVTFKGLGAGDYTITETKTLPGYNTIEPINFTVSVDTKDEDALTLTFKTNNENIKVEADNTLATTIINYTGNTLPETGGIGTTIFYVLGSLMAIGAAVILIAKRRVAR